MIRRLITATIAIALAAVLAQAGNQEMRTYELYSGANRSYSAAQTDSSARVSYTIPVKGARKIYLWIRSAGVSTDTSFCDSLTTFSANFGDSVSFIARDSSGTLVTLRNFPANTGGYGNKAFPVIADSVALTTTGQEDTLHWHMLTHFATTRPLRAGVIARIDPDVRQSVNASGAIIPRGTPDNSGVIQSNYMWLRLTETKRSTSAGSNSTQGLRTQGVNGLRVTATLLFDNR